MAKKKVLPEVCPPPTPDFAAFLRDNNLLNLCEEIGKPQKIGAEKRAVQRAERRAA